MQHIKVPVWLELRPANDANWRRFADDEATLAAAEHRARAMIQCKIVTPEGVRIVWSPRDERAPAPTYTARDLAEFARLGRQ